jgi:hypothetical protein
MLSAKRLAIDLQLLVWKLARCSWLGWTMPDWKRKIGDATAKADG